MPGPTRAAVQPRLSATILLLRDNPFEVLMVKRHAKSYFASALVFPGGVVDPQDASPEWLPHVDGAEALSEQERACRIAACRETFEEAAILITSDGRTRLTEQVETQSPPGRFLDWVRDSGSRLALHALCPFGHWITPVAAPKRFDTHFYLCCAPSGQAGECDGGETVSLEWLNPQNVLAGAQSGAKSERILFPTQLNLKRLAESSDSMSAIAAARARPVITVTPRVVRVPEGVRVVIPVEAGYGVTESAILAPGES